MRAPLLHLSKEPFLWKYWSNVLATGGWVLQWMLLNKIQRKDAGGCAGCKFSSQSSFGGGEASWQRGEKNRKRSKFQSELPMCIKDTAICANKRCGIPMKNQLDYLEYPHLGSVWNSSLRQISLTYGWLGALLNISYRNSPRVIKICPKGERGFANCSPFHLFGSRLHYVIRY